MKIKVEPFLMPKKFKVGRAAIEFESSDGILAGFYLVGFDIMVDDKNQTYVRFPSSVNISKAGSRSIWYFLRGNAEILEKLEHEILDVYETMIDNSGKEK